MKNMYLRAVLGSFVLTGGLMAQTSVFDKPPAGVEDALRARVSRFYQAFVDSKFRLADQVVAEDSKDEFFAADKTRYYGFQISQITWEQNFTRARVVVLADTDVQMFAAPPVRMKAPLTTVWKLENGEWWWFVLKRKPGEDVVTPFGRIHAAAVEKERAAGGPAPAIPARMMDLEGLSRLVQADKKVVRLKPGAEPEIVTITNGMPGPVSLRLETAEFPGLSVKLDRTDVGAKEKAHVEFRYVAMGKRGRNLLTVRVVALPANTTMPIAVVINQ